MQPHLEIQANPDIRVNPVILDILILVIRSLNERKNRAGTESAMSNFLKFIFSYRNIFI